MQFLIRSISITLLFGVLMTANGSAQSFSSSKSFVPVNYQFKPAFEISDSLQTEFPDPKKVLRQSLILPGWGQVTNNQIWKVPIVYGVIGGLTYYSIHLNKRYGDYRAAYYNLNPQSPDDNKFGPTPGYISEDANLEALRQTRNNFRNRRDLVFVFIGLSYALNAIDAYVFAHLRSFDVSDDLSMNIQMKPVIIAARKSSPSPSISLSINF
ncbi:DUF5683 domain-containing protein [Gracilimonas halophila]|uniref:DUF5683 domain-containing protein n=1 Tax=Gracilimonas halophila TaxID=1834464 RepID=UPI0036F1C817